MKAEVHLAILLLAIGIATAASPATSFWSSRTGSNRGLHQDEVLGGVSAVEVRAVLDSAIEALRTSSPFTAQIKLQIDLLDRQFVGSGRYLQSGQGNPKARWDLCIDDDATNLLLTQVFDGRFFYRLEVHGDSKNLSYVDLYSVRDLGNKTTPGIAGISGWFGTGSLATVLEQLMASFDFESQITTQVIESEGKQPIRMNIVRGQWSQSGLRQLLRDQISPEILGSEIQWDRMPGQLPHAVDLYFGTDDYLQAFPYQMTFYQFVRSNGDRFVRKKIFQIQLHRVEKQVEIADDEFHITAEDVRPIDLTRDYLDRIKMFTQHPLKD